MTIAALYDVPAPAKLNLYLHVVGRRDDGMHLIESLMVLIDWCDTIHVEARNDGLLRRQGAFALLAPRFPDLHLEVLDSSADEGMVAQRILFTGTHTGSFRGLPPSNRQVRFSGLEINRMVDAKVAEHWFQLDTVTLFQQLGLRVVPGPRLLPRLLASRLFRQRRRTVQS